MGVDVYAGGWCWWVGWVGGAGLDCGCGGGGIKVDIITLIF